MLVVALFATSTLLAAPVTKDAAKTKAVGFLQQKSAVKGKRQAQQNMSLVSDSPEDAAYYVFNNANGDGFVLVSGEDAAGDILGYSEQGTLDEANMPENLRALLDEYAAAVKFARDNDITMQKAPRKAGRADVAHFVNFAWDQSGKYAQNCPEASSRDDGHCSTGCMAVTTGMIVAYYKYPETLPAAYNSNVSWNEQVSNEAWAPDYSKFLSSYGSYSDAGEMPRFMRHIADALNTSYSSGGSSAQAPAFKTAMVNFGYDPAMRTVQRDAMSQADWDELIYQEVAAKRPVFLYGDHSVLGGHSYLCDGYQASTGFFYMNWGWGGTCNGWFDMGILNPFVTYFSSWGSMKYDCPPAGFTSGLKAVINVQPKPENAVESIELLTINSMRLEGDKVIATYLNYNEQSYTGQIAWAELNGDGSFALLENTVENLNSMSSYKTKNLEYGALDLGEGTHNFVLVCKKSDATDYNLCEGYNHAYAEIIVEGGNTTVKPHPVKDVVVENVSYFGTTGYTADQYYEVVATLKNNGDDTYKSVKINGVRNDGVKVGGSIMNIGLPAGESNTFSLFIEKGTGWSSSNDYSYDLDIYFDNEKIWTGTILMKSQMGSYTEYKSVDFEDYAYVDDHAELYSTVLKGNINILNNTTYYVFNEAVRITLKDKDKNIVGQTMQQFVVDKNAMQAYPVNFEGLKAGEKYYLSCEAMTSTRSGSAYTYKADKAYFTDFEITVKAGIPYYTEGGMLERKMLDPNSTEKVDLPANTAAVDFTKFSVDNVNLSSIENPNCVYYFNEDAEVPAELNGKNVVVGGVAESITLTDGNAVAFPKDFTAQNISYTRTFEKGNNGDDQGWQTIVLPFSATVTVGGEKVDWFHSKSDSGRKFWLYQYINGVGGTAYFDFETASTMTADTPYIIAVPGNKWGDKYDLTNKEFTFEAENAAVKANVKPEEVSGEYNFCGTYGIATQANAYKLNDNGDFFELQDKVTEKPFRAFFKSTEVAAGSRTLRIAMYDDQATGINMVNSEMKSTKSNAVYNMNGQHVAQPQKGVYVVNGKKVIMK